MSSKKTKTESSTIQIQRGQKHHYREEYLVQVTVMEARQLKGKDSSGTSDPFVKITVGNLPPQVTTTAYGAASAVWNQSFTFTNLFINDMEFEKFEILLEVIDMNKFTTNSLIGRYSVGLATLYRSSNHELYNTWLALTHPESDLEPQGFLLVSAYIVGTEDRPPVHAINEIVYFDEEPDEFEGLADEELTADQLKIRRERAKNPAVIGKPSMITRKYQMMVNIVRGEDFPILGMSKKCDPFVSARCCGNVLISQVAKNTTKPQYYAKLCFPCEFPVYNDKVVIRVWDKCFLAADNFIANVPEIAKENDFFSLNYLQSRGGLMPFRWFNLYGIPPEERNPNIIDYFFKGNKLIEGTEYFGRILLSLSLNSHDKPVKAVQQLNAFREPASINYILRVDTYELQGAKDCGPQVKVRVRVGPYSCTSQATYQKKDYELSKKEGKKMYIPDAYEWKENKIKIEEERCDDLPQDKTQIPDIIISLLTNSNFSKDTFKRVAYLRIPVTSDDISTNKPKWYALKSISNNLDPSVHSYILLNISLRMSVGNQEIPRIPIKRNIKCSFMFAAYLWGGYNLDPESSSDDIQAKVKVRIAHYQKELQNIKIGRNPIWNECLLQIVDLDEQLEFASNIIITIDNPRKKLLGLVNLYEANMGEICVSALDCKSEKDPSDTNFSPAFQFYHIMKDGVSQGRILGAFHLYKLTKKRNPLKDEYRRAVEFANAEKDLVKSKIEFCIVGIRNLPSPVKSPQMRIRIAIDPPLEKSLTNPSFEQLKKNSFIEQIISPKGKQSQPEQGFGLKIATTGESSMGTQNPNFLYIYRNELDLPKHPKYFPVIEVEFLSDGYFQSNYNTEIQLYEMANWLNDIEKLSARTFYEEGKNPPHHHEDTKAVKEMDEALDAEGVKITINTENNEEDSKRKLLDDRATDKKNPQDGERHLNDDKPTLKPGDATKEEKKEEKEKIEEFDERKGKKKLDDSYDDEADLFIRNDKFFNAKFEEILDVMATKIDKTEEDKWRRESIDHLKAEIMGLDKFNKFYDQLKTKKINEILKLKLSKMTEEKFKVQDDKIGEDYNYGRDVHKGEIKERLQLPYDKYELQECSLFSQSVNTYNSRVRKIRQKSQGSIFLKGKIKIERIEDSAAAAKSQRDDARSKKTKSSTTTKRSVQKSIKGLKYDREYPFKIFDEKFLEFFDKVPPMKCRVYILRCLNLSAQSNHVDTAHMLAGLEGKCSANAYPEVLVGNGENIGEMAVKIVCDSERSIPQDLNPKFFRMFELDAFLPQDWKLVLRIWNKEFIKDSLIGSVEVDIEDRLWGQPELRQRMTLQIYKAHYEAKKLKIKYNFEKNQKKEHYEKKLSDINSYIELIDKDFKVPVEYAALMNPDKKTSQGIVEMFIEPFPVEVAKLIPASAIDPPQPMEFEIRLVIWETYNVFRTKGVVDIFVRVSQEAFGWVSDGIKKETDTHLGSEDGYGLFNWRMTFPLQIPCPFPRLRFAVFDMETLSSDESIGECVISFMKIIKRLRTEGKYDMQPRKLKIYHPNFPDEVRGEILISLNIISKQEAANNPVGDGQSEPNHDPFLEAPKVGRGIGDFLKGTMFDFSLWKLFGMRALKILLASLFSLIVTLILFVKPGILVK